MKEMFNAKEVAEYFDIHEKQLYRRVKERKIPATKITGKWLFPKASIDEFIKGEFGQYPVKASVGIGDDPKRKELERRDITHREVLPAGFLQFIAAFLLITLLNRPRNPRQWEARCR